MMECITTASFSVLVNGISRDPFRPERGVRQGDPLSPYIFIIYAEYLDRYINFMANTSKSGIGIKVAKNGLTIPYLKFADDCLIFCEVNRRTARHVKSVLDNYCRVSGQLVNFHKSFIQILKV